MSIIRKISVGSNHPKSVMTYYVGQNFKLAGKDYKVSGIVESDDSMEGYRCYDVILTGEVSIVWKKIENMPVVLEYLMNF